MIEETVTHIYTNINIWTGKIPLNRLLIHQLKEALQQEITLFNKLQVFYLSKNHIHHHVLLLRNHQKKTL